MGIYHKYQSSRSDAGGSSKVQPSHWNQVHKSPQNLVWCLTANPRLFWRIPEIKTEFAGGSVNMPPYPESPGQRTRYDFSRCTTTRLAARVVQDADLGSIKCEYSVNGTTWADISNAVSMTVQGFIPGTNFNIPAAAKALVWVRVVAFGGKAAGTGPVAEIGGIYLYGW